MKEGDKCACGRRMPWHLIGLGLNAHHCGCGRQYEFKQSSFSPTTPTGTAWFRLKRHKLYHAWDVYAPDPCGSSRMVMRCTGTAVAGRVPEHWWSEPEEGAPGICQRCAKSTQKEVE